MEVLCGGDSFTPADIPCGRELWTLGVVKVIKKEDNQAIALAVARNAETQSGRGSRDPVLKTAGCASRDKMAYRRFSSNTRIFGYQLFGH
jgi:hypothetical protein